MDWPLYQDETPEPTTAEVLKEAITRLRYGPPIEEFEVGLYEVQRVATGNARYSLDELKEYERRTTILP